MVAEVTPVHPPNSRGFLNRNGVQLEDISHAVEGKNAFKISRYVKWASNRKLEIHSLAQQSKFLASAGRIEAANAFSILG
ncbi:hypothetical protein C5167_004506 [Papaver somniferum]|uniref:Uncharacterized protein n=1 Tax=Papaver somniferum TaxID=3469 RepID=A0A4Y7J9P2_PAPSO|nr:hypothetical protein C5167_004505 [Papaver somniferum]RZC57208.1 hypothetical protein C5167_004506 [Papaver somniferum]